ncbi:MAG TPA: thermonuclease family protein [Rhizomicrobium sp.]|nr:thermonuclease family protein [Rhizomicrobium sp.]
MRLFAVALGACLIAGPALAAPLPACAPPIEIANVKVKRVEKNGVLVLPDGRAVHLEGIVLPAGSADHAPSFLAAQAIDELTDLARDRTISAAAIAPKEDRYGRLRAQVFFRQDDIEPWLQVALLRRGFARVYIAPDRRECASALFAAEKEARDSRAGIWAQAAYAVRTPDQLGKADTGTFQIVQGKLLSADVKDGRAYLDFGTDWHSDFTVTISPDDMKTFRTIGVDPRTYAGKTVRVRGWIEQLSGPEIEVPTPQDIEMME